MMASFNNNDEAAEIHNRVLALSESLDALKDDALSLFVKHSNEVLLRNQLANLIEGLDSAWQDCSLDALVHGQSTEHISRRRES
jgi:hypothetical protein